MTLTKHTSLKRLVALALTAAFLMPPGAGLLTSARAQDPGPVAPAAPAPPSVPATAGVIRIPMAPVEAGPIKSILLFPFANAIPAGGSTAGFNPDIVGARVEDAIKLRLNTIGRYQASSFSPRLPQMQRALSEPSATGQGITENDLVPPYTSGATGQRITSQVGTDGYLLGTIEALSQDPKTRSVNLTISATLYSTVTGGPVKVLAYTGHGVSFNTTDDPNMLLQSAINDASGHVVSALNAQAAPQQKAAPVDFKRGRRSNKGSILLGILIAVGIGVAISAANRHGHSNNGGGNPITPANPVGPGIPAPPTGLGNGLGGTTGGTIGGGGTLFPPGVPGT